MKLLFIMGTRPEAIKLAPLILQCRADNFFEVKVIVTAQHRGMLDQVLAFFSIIPDYDLSLMKPGQTLAGLTSACLEGISNVLTEEKEGLVIVQGDTTSAFTGALCAFYQKLKIAHVEAGLRSGNIQSPFPEEANRKFVGVVADYHFAPTSLAKQNLLKENITDHVYVVGNTVIDALLMGREKIEQDSAIDKLFPFLDAEKKLILITGHRRESFGEPFEEFCNAIADIASRYPDVQLIYPVHLNPQVQQPVRSLLSEYDNIFLTDPVDYPTMIYLMNRCHFVITDSGGVQEEAPSLGKPVLVTREVTERTEGIDAGTAKLVGTLRERITSSAFELIDDTSAYQAMANAVNPYGDGTTCKQIIEILKTLQ